MTNVGKNLSKILDIEEVSDAELLPTTITENEIIVKNDIDSDVDFARKNIKELIQKGNLAFDDLLKVAKESEHPRSYEVTAGFLKNLSDLNKDLLELQKRKKDLSPEQNPQTKNINVDKAVFVGSTTELVKFIKENK